MKVRRFYDLPTLEKAVNRDDVLPYVAAATPGEHWLDMSAFFKRKGNMAFKGGRGVMLACLRSRGVYEIHYLFPTDMRGPVASQIAKEVLRLLFTEYRARAIVGKVPVGNLPSRMFSRHIGGVSTGKCRDHTGNPCIGYKLERSRWVELQAALPVA